MNIQGFVLPWPQASLCALLLQVSRLSPSTNTEATTTVHALAVSVGGNGDENQNEYLLVYRRVLVVLPSLSPLENPEIK